MSSYSERGVVLHSLKYSENQLIVHVLTELHGRRSYITRIAGRGSGRNLYQPLYLIEFQATTGKGEMHKISQVSASQPLCDIPHNIIKSTISLFIAEVLYRIIKDEAVDNRLYEFVYGSVVALDLMQDFVANFHLHFLVRLSHYLGFAPQGRYGSGYWFDVKNGQFQPNMPEGLLSFAPEQAQMLYQFSQCSVAEISQIELNRTQRNAFIDNLVDFYGFHTESIYSVNSIAMFREIF